MLPCARRVRNQREQQLDCQPPRLFQRLRDRRKPDVLGKISIIETKHSDLLGHPHP